MTWLGQVYIAGYEWTVVSDSRQGAEAALRAEYKRRLKAGHIHDVTDGTDPLEYHGARYHELAPGEVQWL
jgi:hypothetical protein